MAGDWSAFLTRWKEGAAGERLIFTASLAFTSKNPLSERRNLENSAVLQFCFLPALFGGDFEEIETLRYSGQVPPWGLLKCQPYGAGGVNQQVSCKIGLIKFKAESMLTYARTTTQTLIGTGWELKQITTAVSGAGQSKGSVSGGILGVNGKSRSSMKIFSNDTFDFYKPPPKK